MLEYILAGFVEEGDADEEVDLNSRENMVNKIQSRVNI
jgi:hypothetical protein